MNNDKKIILVFYQLISFPAGYGVTNTIILLDVGTGYK